MKNIFTKILLTGLMMMLAACSSDTIKIDTGDKTLDTSFEQILNTKVNFAYIEDAELGEKQIDAQLNDSGSKFRKDLYKIIFEQKYEVSENATFNNEDILVIIRIDNADKQPVMLYVCDNGILRVLINRTEETIYTGGNFTRADIENLIQKYPEIYY